MKKGYVATHFILKLCPDWVLKSVCLDSRSIASWGAYDTLQNSYVLVNHSACPSRFCLARNLNFVDAGRLSRQRPNLGHAVTMMAIVSISEIIRIECWQGPSKI